MSIKRRLFISNILMLVIPIILSFMITSGIMFVFMEATSTDGGPGNVVSFFDSIKRTNALVGSWSPNIDFELMKDEVQRFNEKQGNSKASLAIYKGKELLYPSSSLTSSPILDTALTESDSHMSVMDNTAMYKKSAGEYSIILIDNSLNSLSSFNRENNKDYRGTLFSLGIIIFLFVIIIILLTNRFLTKFVFKSIVTPLDTLVYGVRQIRDGNLDYHIDYEGKDEFAGVCSDFNEMAQRLLDSVNVRQKDETNRKELIAGISHDLRTPLTSIKAYVEGLEKGVAQTPENQKRYLDTIKSKTTDLEHIVNKLFLFSKLDIGEFPFYLEEVNIGNELESMINNLSEEYKKKGLNISLTQNVQNMYVKVDIVQLRNAVMNVLENSVKYKNKEQGEMKIRCKSEYNYVVIALQDDGPGVSEEAINKLFDIFYRSDPSRTNPSKGSGIGLAITAKILERLGGSIRAENIPEGGLSIVMSLPKYYGDRTINNCSVPQRNTGDITINNCYAPQRNTGGYSVEKNSDN